MRKPISEVVKELDVKAHQLHQWETNGWLGPDDVLKDPDLNNQRVYSEQQVDRIRFLKTFFEEKRDQGIKRVAPKMVEEALLEKFGGEVIEIEKNEISVLPSSFEEFQHVMLQQRNMIVELKDMVQQLQQRELPEPAMTKEQAEELFSRLASQEKEKNEIENEMKLIKEKLDIAVDYIQKQENQEKKSLWKRLFG